jgi:hypothetical protein
MRWSFKEFIFGNTEPTVYVVNSVDEVKNMVADSWMNASEVVVSSKGKGFVYDRRQGVGRLSSLVFKGTQNGPMEVTLQNPNIEWRSDFSFRRGKVITE